VDSAQQIIAEVGPAAATFPDHASQQGMKLRLACLTALPKILQQLQ
jgi:hypothetical protein